MPNVKSFSDMEEDKEESFLEFDAPSDVLTRKDKVLMFDFHNLIYRSVYAVIFNTPEDNEEFLLTKHTILNSIFESIEFHNPTRVVVAIDSQGSWRKDIFPAYKAHRKRQKSKVELNRDKFFPAVDELVEDMKQLFSNMFFLKVDHMEADDIIATLCNKVYCKIQNETVIISTDSDLNQLLKHKNIKQYDPGKKEFVNSINPIKAKEVKILSGDKSDNIPPIKRLVGPKTAEKILEEGIMTYIDTIETEEEKTLIMENYHRNKALIDLDEIPKAYSEKILNNYTSYETSPLNGKNAVKFFMTHGLLKHLEDWQRRAPLMKSLK